MKFHNPVSILLAAGVVCSCGQDSGDKLAGTEEKDAAPEKIQPAEAPPSPLEELFSSVKPQPSSNALLLGFSGKRGYETYLIRTPSFKEDRIFMVPYLVVPHSGKVSIIARDSILMTRSFRQAESFYSCRTDFLPGEDDSLMAKLDELISEGRKFLDNFMEGARKNPDAVQPWEYSRTDGISFITTRFVSKTTEYSGYSGGAHGFFSSSHFTSRIGTGKRVTLDEFYGGQNVDLVTKALMEKLTQHAVPRDMLGGGMPTLDEISFYLGRWSGLTVITGIGEIEVPYVVSPTYRLHAETPVGPAPGEIAPHNGFSLDYRALSELIKEMKDATTSPGNDALIVILKDGIDAYDLASGSIYASQKFSAGEVIMAEWLTDEAVIQACDAAFQKLYRRDLKNELTRKKADMLALGGSAEKPPVTDLVPPEWILLSRKDGELVRNYSDEGKVPGIIIKKMKAGPPSLTAEFSGYTITARLTDYAVIDSNSIAFMTPDSGIRINFTWADDDHTIAYWIIPGMPEEYEGLYVAAAYSGNYPEAGKETPQNRK